MRRLLLTISIAIIGTTFAFAPIAHAAETFTLGDADGNGVVNAADADYIINFIQSGKEPTTEFLCRADVDGDGRITSADAEWIYRYLAGTPFPQREAYITILITGNLRGAILETDPVTGSARQASFMRLFPMVERYRAQGKLLLLDAGSSLFGSAETQAFRHLYGNRDALPGTEIFKKLQYDAIFLSAADFAQGLSALRVQLDALKSVEPSVQVNEEEEAPHPVPAVCANFVKVDPTSADKAHTPWNRNLAYFSHTMVVRGRPVPIAAIGLAAAEGLAAADMVGVLGASTERMVDVFQFYQRELRANYEYTIAIVNAPMEADEATGRDEENSVRFFAENTSGIQLIVCAQGEFSGVRTFTNAAGRPVLVTTLGSDGSNALVLDLVWDSENERMDSWIHTEPLPSAATPAGAYAYAAEILQEAEDLFASRLSAVPAPIARMEDAREDSDWMRFVHDAHIWNVLKWGKATKADLPVHILSLSYPYLQIPEEMAHFSGRASLRDILQCIQDEPSFSLVLLSGAELRAYLQDLANNIREAEPVYSLRGINYTLDPSAAYGSTITRLSYPDGTPVRDGDTLAVFVAEAGERGSQLSPYFDSEWLSAEYRFLYFSFVVPNGFTVPGGYAAAAPLVYFLGQMTVPPIADNGEWKIINR
ncbi:MAG: dockerin type I domain-containing protein [Clostridiales bacterium]|nr:dockerin type I domain-containing protein [Clostridiales bacterium]